MSSEDEASSDPSRSPPSQLRSFRSQPEVLRVDGTESVLVVVIIDAPVEPARHHTMLKHDPVRDGNHRDGSLMRNRKSYRLVLLLEICNIRLDSRIAHIEYYAWRRTKHNTICTRLTCDQKLASTELRLNRWCPHRLNRGGNNRGRLHPTLSRIDHDQHKSHVCVCVRKCGAPVIKHRRTGAPKNEINSTRAFLNQQIYHKYATNAFAAEPRTLFGNVKPSPDIIAGYEEKRWVWKRKESGRQGGKDGNEDKLERERKVMEEKKRKGKKTERKKKGKRKVIEREGKQRTLDADFWTLTTPLV